MAIFQARFDSRCTRCGNTIRKGTLISWSKRAKGVVYHADCDNPDATERTAGTQDRAAEHEAQGSGSQSGGEAQAQAIPQTFDAAALLAAVNTACERLEPVITRKAVAAAKRAAKATTIVVEDRIKGETRTIDGAHDMMPRLMYLLSGRRHAYAWGPPGSGKSKGASLAAEALGMRYGYLSLNPQTPESRLLGFIDAGGHYRRTVFRDCYEHGGVMCIDELDNAHPALLNTLNGMIEQGAKLGPFPDGMVERHADFVMVATGNTNGRGGDRLFPERRALDPAFAERFTFLRWDYDESLETRLVAAISQSAEARAWLAFIRKVRRYCAEHGLRVWATPRASMRGAEILADAVGWSAADMAEAVLFKGLDADTVARIVNACPLPEFSKAQGESDDADAEASEVA